MLIVLCVYPASTRIQMNFCPNPDELTAKEILERTAFARAEYTLYVVESSKPVRGNKH